MVDPAGNLFRGTADFYDRFRLAYPPAMTTDLLTRVQPSGRGRLLDLACGTGQLACALHAAFAETWAVDGEPDMIARLTASVGERAVRPVVATAESFVVDPASLQLITVGNAFHRLQRDVVAVRAFDWLGPGGHLALCWSSAPWTGDVRWQRALRSVLARWQDRLTPGGRVLDAATARRDAVVLADAGFQVVGRYEFVVMHRWTVAELTGFVYSTSFLGAPVVGDRAAEFEADLAERLGPHLDNGFLPDRIGYAYDLARKPPQRA